MSSYSPAGRQSAARRIVRSSTPMRAHTIGALELWLDRAARERPDAAAVDGVGYAELNGLANVYARGLVAAGVGPGDRVATLMPPDFEFAGVLHALPKVGA